MIKLKYVLALTTMMFVAAVAIAGSSLEAPVNIDLDSMVATGSQKTARFSDNDVDLIGCGVRATSNGDRSGFCQAANADAGFVSCMTTNTDLLDNMRATSAFAFIFFAWDEDFDCTLVSYSTQSFHLPEFKLKK